MAHLLTGALGAVEIGASVAGVPLLAGAAMLLQEIAKACEDMRIHKVSVITAV
jgi:hypothetical protein